MKTAGLCITAVLEHYGAHVSKIRGSGWRPIRCPFPEGHSRGDRVLSASVSLGKNAFCCHACGVKGDAIGIIKQREGLDYRGAIAFSQEVLGVNVEDVPHPTTKPRRRPGRWRKHLSDIA